MAVDRNKAPSVYPAHPHPRSGYSCRFAYYDEHGKERRRRGYGRTPSEAEQDARDRWWRLVGEVREILAGRRPTGRTGAAWTWVEAANAAAPALALAQKPRQVTTTLHYVARYWAGFCPRCSTIDREAVDVVDDRLDVRRARCEGCGGRLLGGLPLSELTSALCASVLAAARGMPSETTAGRKRGATLANATINRIRSAGSVVFAHAVDAGVIEVAPTDRVRRVKEPRRVPALLTGDDALALADALDDDWRPFVLLMLCAGLRLSEARFLRPADVELDRGRIVVRLGSEGEAPKSGHERIVPIVSSRLGAALAAAVEARGAGETVARFAVPRKAINRAAKAAGVRAPTRHELRHLFCSAMLAAGVPPPTVRAWLGHSGLNVTDRYAHAVRWSAGFAELFDQVGVYTTGRG